MYEYEKNDGDYGNSGGDSGQGNHYDNSQDSNNESSTEGVGDGRDGNTDSSVDGNYYNSSDNGANGNYYNSSDNSTNDNYYNNSGNSTNDNYYNSSNTGTSGNYYDSYNNDYYNGGQNDSNNYYNNTGSTNNNQGPDNRKKKKFPVAAIVIIVAAIVLVIALAVTIFATYNTIQNSDSGLIDDTQKTYDDIGTTEIETDGTDEETDASDESTSSSGITITDVSDIVEATIPSVVAITSTELVESGYTYYDNIYDWYFGGGSSGDDSQTYEEQSAGSGIIVDQTDTEILIVTNNHVVEGADGIEVQFYGQSGEETVEANLKGTDADADVAIVAVQLEDIPDDILGNIKKAVLGDSDSVEVGEGVIAIGNALGEGQSVTTGIISAKDKEATIEDVTMTLLQTDAAINGGNSGGALINSSGEVIGINVAKYSSSGDSTSASIEGMGFAIPISSVKEIISDLETKDTKTKVDENEQGYLGITGFDVSDDDATQYSMPVGVYVYSVVEGGPAAEAGIEESDIIVGFDGQTVSTMSALQSLMEYYAAGDKVEVTIAYKDGKEYKEKDVTVTLGDESVTEGLESSSGGE